MLTDVFQLQWTSSDGLKDNGEALKYVLKDACEKVHLGYSNTRLETVVSTKRHLDTGANDVRNDSMGCELDIPGIDCRLPHLVADSVSVMTEYSYTKYCGVACWHPRGSAEYRLTPSRKIRLGTNCETSSVPTRKFTVTRQKNRSCKYMEDMYCDNDYRDVTPTRCSVLITFESGDELISLREQFSGRAEQHLLQHCSQLSGWLSTVLLSVVVAC